MNDQLNDLLDEMVNESMDLSQVVNETEPVKETKVDGDNLQEVYYEKMGKFFDSGQNVINELQVRIQQGDTFEGTITGYTQTLTTLKGLLDTAQKPLMEKNKQMHQLKLEAVKHENKTQEIQMRNESKANTSTKLEQNNFYLGGGGFSSLQEFLKGNNLESDQVMDVIDVED